MTPDDLQARAEQFNLAAYYYAFTPTGVLAVDRILAAVARAGKLYHHTEDWNETPTVDGQSPVHSIQDAANRAADELRTVQAATWREAAKKIRRWPTARTMNSKLGWDVRSEAAGYFECQADAVEGEE